MAALTTNRSTTRQGFDTLVPNYSYPIKAATKLFLGGMVALDATGNLVAMTAAAGLNPVGVVGEVPPGPNGLDNTAGASGAFFVAVYRGIFLLDSGTAGDLVTQAFVGLPAYAMDDHTVSPVATARTKVGIIMQLDVSGQVWVQITGPL
jgi:hypothetical protein